MFENLVLRLHHGSILQHACLLQSCNERVLVSAKAKEQFFESDLRARVLFFIVRILIRVVILQQNYLSRETKPGAGEAHQAVRPQIH